MAIYRAGPPQLSGEWYLTDAGVEADLIFNHGVEILAFACHTRLPMPTGRERLGNYFSGFVSLVPELDVGYVLDSRAWKAPRPRADDLGPTRTICVQPTSALTFRQADEATGFVHAARRVGLPAIVALLERMAWINVLGACSARLFAHSRCNGR